jgi:hypothetical protein
MKKKIENKWGWPNHLHSPWGWVSHLHSPWGWVSHPQGPNLNLFFLSLSLSGLVGVAEPPPRAMAVVRFFIFFSFSNAFIL